MKKLGKLSINVDKIIKNEELVNLRGGDYYSNRTCGAISASGSIYCDLTKTEAIWWAGCDPDGTNCDGNWCCDSCSSTSYCGDS